MNKIWQAVLYITIGLFASGIIWLASSLPVGHSVKLQPPPTPFPIQVHIIGEIERPGLYKLEKNSRVQDAIREAGGLTENADEQAVNLAAILDDGQQILIPPKLPAEGAEGNKNEGAPFGRGPSSMGYLININTATREILETLPGIGPAIAQDIINYRQTKGDFESIEEIQKIQGIGPEKFQTLRDMITVNGP